MKTPTIVVASSGAELPAAMKVADVLIIVIKLQLIYPC